MGRVIIGIHGLSNKPAPEVLKNGWQAAMIEGLEKNAKIKVDAITFESVYWADVTYDEYDPNPDLYHPAADGALKRYKECWLDELRAFGSDICDNVLDHLKKAYGIDTLADKILSSKLKDLHLYYHEKKVKDELRNRLWQQIINHQDKRIMVVSHSMGTIIAYDVLRAIGREYPMISVDHFVTLGSPLGMPHVKYKIAQESSIVRTPSIVKKWTNLADKRDPVAIDTNLADDYECNDYGVKVQDDLVLNDWGGLNHKSYGYLRTPEFTEQLKRFL